jgi:hypothetical protein
LLKDKINNESHKGWEGSPFHQQLEAKKLNSKQKSKKAKKSIIDYFDGPPPFQK